MRKINNKKAAFEMSIGTIVVIVLSMTMLILGIVLIRNIMCAGIGLTGEINSKVRGEIDTLFQTSGGEVVCLGSSGDPLTVIPGRTNIIYCAVNAPQEATYTFNTVGIPSEITGWVVDQDFSFDTKISAKDRDGKKVLRIAVPDTADEKDYYFSIEVSRDGSLVSTQQIDISVKSAGFLKTAMC